jgi:hypothetical protein
MHTATANTQDHPTWQLVSTNRRSLQRMNTPDDKSLPYHDTTSNIKNCTWYQNIISRQRRTNQRKKNTRQNEDYSARTSPVDTGNHYGKDSTINTTFIHSRTFLTNRAQNTTKFTKSTTYPTHTTQNTTTTPSYPHSKQSHYINRNTRTKTTTPRLEPEHTLTSATYICRRPPTMTLPTDKHPPTMSNKIPKQTSATLAAIMKNISDKITIDRRNNDNTNNRNMYHTMPVKSAKTQTTLLRLPNHIPPPPIQRNTESAAEHCIPILIRLTPPTPQHGIFDKHRIITATLNAL